MNARIHAVALLFAVAAPVAVAQEPAPLLPPVLATGYIADCTHRTLPSQRQVSEWTGQHNPGQAYATRQRLMAEIGRACQRPGVEQVRLVLDKRRSDEMQAADRRVADNGRAR